MTETFDDIVGDDASMDPMSDEVVADVEDGHDDGLDDDADLDAPEQMDPLASWLLRIVLLLVVVLLGSTVVLVVYMMNLRGAPRTAIERTIAQSEVAVEEHPEILENWIEYAYALAKAGRENEAYRVLERGRTLVERSAALDVAEADIMRITGRYEDAIEAYDTASKSATEEHEKYMIELEERGVVMDIPNTALMESHVGRAYALLELDRDDEAITELEYALEIGPTASDLWALLGDLYADAGEDDDARAAYEQALQYIPDLEQALTGLERLDEER